MLDLPTRNGPPGTDLFPPRVGDEVLVARDVLVEVARAFPTAQATWCHLAAGTRGRVIGWRDRPGEEPRAVVDVLGAERRLVVFVRERHVRRIVPYRW